ncbi:hypothetical protein M1563_03770 [Patescibacteria group bacterium]|nr:hypothetical protein [Patescibacteria group bacterium]MCL5409589.1 hypothetical protein [Patescibacteria group bacterium]
MSDQEPKPLSPGWGPNYYNKDFDVRETVWRGWQRERRQDLPGIRPLLDSLDQGKNSFYSLLRGRLSSEETTNNSQTKTETE